MTGWGRQLDDLACATTELLMIGPCRGQLLVDPRLAMAARDAVLVEVRALVGAVSHAPRFAPVRELTVQDVVRRPAQALHRALSELPRAVPFGAVDLGGAGEQQFSEYERAWQRAARATVGLEGYIDGLAGLPDVHAWEVLRDLADVAAALPYLDHDLSEAVLPQLDSGDDLGAAYGRLTHPGHDALRLAAAEVRTRVPTAQPPNADRPGRGQQPGRSGTPAPDLLARRGPDRPDGLAEAMTRYTHAVSARGAHLSVPDLRAVARLLEVGGARAGQVLHRTGPVVAGAGEAARGLHALSGLARRLRDAPARSMTPAHLDLLRDGTELQARVDSLAAQAHRPPGRGGDLDVRRLAAATLPFARHVPALTGALESGVRAAVDNGLMLIPGVADERGSTALTWITSTMGAQRDDPPAVVRCAIELQAAARQLARPVRQADHDLAEYARAPSPTQQATAAARRHAGAARVELRQALADRTTEHPTVLTAELPAHPRLNPPQPRTSTTKR